MIGSLPALSGQGGSPNSAWHLFHLVWTLCLQLLSSSLTRVGELSDEDNTSLWRDGEEEGCGSEWETEAVGIKRKHGWCVNLLNDTFFKGFLPCLKRKKKKKKTKKEKKKTELPVLIFKKTAVLTATYQRPVNWRAHFPSGDGTYWTLAQCDLQMMWVGCSNEFNQPTVMNVITKYHLLYLAQRSAPGSLCKNAGSRLQTLAS